MTARFLLSLAIALGLAGCSGTPTDDKTDTDTTGDDDDNAGDDDDAPTGETGDVPPPGFEANYMLPSGIIAFDAATGSVVTATLEGNPIASAIFLEFGTEAWFSANFDAALQDDYCTIMMPLTSSAFAAWAQADPTVWYGVDYTDGFAGAATDCSDAYGKPIPPEWVGGYPGDPVQLIVEDFGPWGAGVGEVSQAIIDWSANFGAATAADFAQYAVGARIVSYFMETDTFYVFGYEMDPVTYELVLDAKGNLVPLENTAIYNGVGLATGVYVIGSSVYYGL